MTLWTHESRLALLANRYLLPGTVAILLTVDFLAGLNWMLIGADALRSPVYDTAKRIMPMAQYGELLVLLAPFAGLFVITRGRGWLSGFIAGPVIACTWAFWAVMFATVSFHRPDTSYFGAVLCSGLFLLHMLVGLALWHSPVPPPTSACQPERD